MVHTEKQLLENGKNCFWLFLIVSDCFWLFLISYLNPYCCKKQLLLNAKNCFWLFLTVSDCFWLFLIVSDCFWSVMSTPTSIRNNFYLMLNTEKQLFENGKNCFWLFLVAFACFGLLLFMIAFACFCNLVPAISNYLRSNRGSISIDELNKY